MIVRAGEGHGERANGVFVTMVAMVACRDAARRPGRPSLREAGRFRAHARAIPPRRGALSLGT